MSKPAIFVDRDGTLMHEVNYCRDPADVRLFDGAGEALRRLRDEGFVLVIITNQSGIARGLLTEADFEKVQARLLELLGGDLITATYMCPDMPEGDSAPAAMTPADTEGEPRIARMTRMENLPAKSHPRNPRHPWLNESAESSRVESGRRKPSPAMVLEAARDLGLDPARSWFVGDKQIDVQCGLAAGTRTVLVRTGHGAGEDAAGAHFVAKDIASAADFILSDSGAS